MEFLKKIKNIFWIKTSEEITFNDFKEKFLEHKILIAQPIILVSILIVLKVVVDLPNLNITIIGTAYLILIFLNISTVRNMIIRKKVIDRLFTEIDSKDCEIFSKISDELRRKDKCVK